MTQEEKSLLLQDLCARLPYSVKFYAENIDSDGTFAGIGKNEVYLTEYHDWWDIEFVKPYLRPMSSMTEEEGEELETLSYADSIDALTGVLDWFYSRHFDVRGLIEKGLALEAPENMYK